MTIPSMRVITLDQPALARHCHRLQQKCLGFNPDLIVGIATGGAIVAEMMFTDTPHAVVTSCRPSTRRKNRASMLWAVIRLCPLWIRDRLRIWESRRLARTVHANARRSVDIPADSRNAIASATHILVVDDAVDSGVTLKAVREAINAINATAIVASATLTVTTPGPVITPDYTLYDNRTLIRFPWSKDYR